jgi:lysophospholipase L1-like esterase
MSTANPGPARKLLFIVIALLPVVAMLVYTEIKLRETTRGYYDKKLKSNIALRRSIQIHRHSPDPELIYEFTPGAEIRQHGVTYRINEQGFRDRSFDAYEAEKTNDTYRILLIGDSVAWGWGVEQQQRYSDLLEKSFMHEGRSVQIMNMAVNGYATAQEVRVYEKYGQQYDPDLVILHYVLNDAAMEDGGLAFYFMSMNRIEIFLQLENLWKLLVYAGKSNLGLLPPPPENNFRDHYFEKHVTDFEKISSAFRRLQQQAGNSGARVMVLMTPSFEYQQGQSYPWEELHHKIRKESEQNNFVFVDTLQLFLPHEPDTLSFDPIHPNAEGNRLIAGFLKPHVISIIEGGIEQKSLDGVSSSEN